MGREAEIQADSQIMRQKFGLAVERAELQSQVNRAEEKSKVAGEIARVEDQVELEARRAELNSRMEEATTVIPARAQKEAEILRAEGQAARILEDGKATSQAIELLREQW